MLPLKRSRSTQFEQFEQCCYHWSTQFYVSSFKAIGRLVLEEKIVKGNILAGLPCWSSDLDHLNKILFPQPQEALHEMWLQLALWLLRRYQKLSHYESPESNDKE